MINKLLNQIEKIICKYLGLNGLEVDRPKTVKMINNDIVIIKNTPFQRHKSYESLSHFNEHGINQVDETSKKKIGMAAGKALAKNLTISFDEIKIKDS